MAIAAIVALPRADTRPNPREIIDKNGEVVTAIDDTDWLHERATRLLAERGITEPTEEEYAEALEDNAAQSRRCRP
jgi:hypothetical protein